MIAACTLFDSRFSIEGWLCWKSINKFDPCMKFYVLCLDERVYHEASYWRQYCGDIIPIRLYEFENRFRQLLDSRATRPWNAYTQTCKVFLPSYIFERFGENKIFYVDCDLYFWSTPKQIEDALRYKSFMVSSRELEPPPIQGRYNGGFYACCNDDKSKVFLNWWQNKTIEWCLWEPGPDGRYAEEGYLNIFYNEPKKFQGIKISSNPGINLANWNLNKHQLKRVDDKIIIDDYYYLVCFHYQGMRFYKDHYETYADIRNSAAKYIYEKYYNDYIAFKEEFLNGLESSLWR